VSCKICEFAIKLSEKNHSKAPVGALRSTSGGQRNWILPCREDFMITVVLQWNSFYLWIKN